MKPFTTCCRLIAATTALLAAHGTSLADDERRAPERVTLQVHVDVPPSWNTFLEDDVAEAFADRLHETFRREGYLGRVGYLHRLDDPQPNIPILEIRLTEWRIDRIGQALCTFTAKLRTPRGEKDLGRVTDTAIFWPVNGGRWSVHRRLEAADALEDAAERALRGLYERIVKSDLLPGAKKE